MIYAAGAALPMSPTVPRRRLHTAVLVVVALFLAACAPDLGPAPRLQSVDALADQRSFAAPAAAWPTDAWWKAYGDPQLDALETEALAGAPDIRIAQARLREAEASAQQAGASLWPKLTGSAALQPTEQSINETFPSAPSAFQKFLPPLHHGHRARAKDYHTLLDGARCCNSDQGFTSPTRQDNQPTFRSAVTEHLTQALLLVMSDLGSRL